MSKKPQFDDKYAGMFRQIAESPNLDIKRIPTGLLNVDEALEGGLPVGRVIEFAGDPGTLKSTMALSAAAQVIKGGGKVLYIDLEGGLSLQYLTSVGIDPEDPSSGFYIAQAGMAEDILEMVLDAVENERFDLIILDSIAGLTPKSELEGEMGDANVAGVARLLSKFTRRLMIDQTSSSTTIILINQFRETIGGMGYGPTKKTTGGRALPYVCSLRVEFINMGQIKDSRDVRVGSTIKFKVVKSRVSRPFVEPVFEHYFDGGIDYVGTVLKMAAEAGFVQQSGAWWTIEGERAQGLTKARDLVRCTPGLYDSLVARLRKIEDVSVQ